MSLAENSGGPLGFPGATGHSPNKIDCDRFQAAVTDYLMSPTTRECLTEDMKNLTDIVTSMESCFADISHQMTRIDNKKILLGQGGCLIELAPEWKDLHEGYTLLMMDSQLAASQTSSKIDDLLKVIFPILKSDLALEKKEKSLDKYIKSLETFQAEGRKNSKRFSGLKHGVDSFRKRVKDIATDQNEEVGRKIEKLDKKIAKLQADLESSSKFFTACWDVLAFSAPGAMASAGTTVTALGTTGSVAGFSSLSRIAPAVGIGILAIGSIFLGFSILNSVKERGEQRRVKINELAALKEELDAAVHDAHQLKEVLSQMHALETEFDEMVSRLSSMQNIWDMLVVDAQKLNYVLSSLKTADNAQEFELTSRGVTVTYEMLQLALDQYSLAVAK